MLSARSIKTISIETKYAEDIEGSDTDGVDAKRTASKKYVPCCTAGRLWPAT